VEATGRNVAKVSYATSLMKKGVLISTTEHALSAFVGIGLDNAIVELGQPRAADPRWQRAAVFPLGKGNGFWAPKKGRLLGDFCGGAGQAEAKTRRFFWAGPKKLY